MPKNEFQLMIVMVNFCKALTESQAQCWQVQAVLSCLVWGVGEEGMDAVMQVYSQDSKV